MSSRGRKYDPDKDREENTIHHVGYDPIRMEIPGLRVSADTSAFEKKRTYITYFNGGM